MAVPAALDGVHGFGREDGVEHVGAVDLGAGFGEKGGGGNFSLWVLEEGGNRVGGGGELEGGRGGEWRGCWEEDCWGFIYLR